MPNLNVRRTNAELQQTFASLAAGLVGTWNMVSSRANAMRTLVLVGTHLRFLVRCLVLCFFPVASTAAVVTLFFFIPQMHELLAALSSVANDNTADSAFHWSTAVFFAACNALCALSVWYTARMLLIRRFPDEAADPDTDKVFTPLARWVPRLLGLVIAFAVPIAYEAAQPAGRPWAFANLLAAILTALAPHSAYKRSTWLFFGASWCAWAQPILICYVLYDTDSRFYVAGWVVAALLLIALFSLSAHGALQSRINRWALRGGWPLLAVTAYAMTPSSIGNHANGWMQLIPTLSGHRAVALLLAAGSLSASWFLLYRRDNRTLQRIEHRLGGDSTPAGARRNALSALSRKVLFASVASTIVAITLLGMAPHTIVPVIGVYGIFLLALTAWNVNGSTLLVLLPKVYGWPNLAIIAPALFILVAGIAGGDPHIVRTVLGPVSGDRLDLTEHYEEWKRKRAADPGAPVFLVAAAGGGLRAAYWTATVLAAIDDRYCGALSRNTYAISGVSGGALGMSVFVAAVEERREQARRSGRTLQEATSECELRGSSTSDGLSQRVHAMLAGDYLSPIAGALLFSDTFRLFFPFTPFSDRAQVFESTIERRWKELTGTDVFARPLLDFYEQGRRVDLPILFFNATRAEDGRRVVASPVRFKPDDGWDLLRPKLFTREMPWSTTIHNSARFPYVSPAGTVLTRVEREGRFGPGKPGPAWGRIVDGGYFDNSGAATLQDIVETLRGRSGCEPTQGRPKSGGNAGEANCKKDDDNFVVILITNSPDDRYFCDRKIPANAMDANCGPVNVDVEAEPTPLLAQIMLPPFTVYHARSSRGSLARWNLIEAMDGRRSRQKIIEINLAGRDHPLPGEWRPSSWRTAAERPADEIEFANTDRVPLGWFVGTGSQRYMRGAAQLYAQYFPFIYDVRCSGSTAPSTAPSVKSVEAESWIHPCLRQPGQAVVVPGRDAGKPRGVFR